MNDIYQKIKREVFRRPGNTSKTIFENSGLDEVQITILHRISMKTAYYRKEIVSVQIIFCSENQEFLKEF